MSMLPILRLQFLSIFIFLSSIAYGQDKVNPIVQDFGGIYEIPKASVKADANLEYNIVIDVYSGPTSPSIINPALNNVARMLNLHAVSGADPGKMNVVLAIHGGATYAVLNNDVYQKKYEIDNPNVALIQSLKDAGVKLTVCGQSLMGRQVSQTEVNENIEIATSMLTTVTTYQLKGYAFLKF